MGKETGRTTEIWKTKNKVATLITELIDTL